MKRFLLFSPIIFMLSHAALIADCGPIAGQYYTDEFGPLASNYSMGDFVRYTVTPDLNSYSGIVKIPYAQDVVNYKSILAIPSSASSTGLTHIFNLYNAIGYLYAGYAAFNINPAATTISNWLKYRTPGSGSLNFDNNTTASSTIQLVDPQDLPTGETVTVRWGAQTNLGTIINPKSIYTQLASAGQDTGLSVDQGQFCSCCDMSPKVAVVKLGRHVHEAAALANANASCSWNTNTDDGNFILAMTLAGTPFRTYSVASPYGQFFGARLAHILGAVVNDVPTAAATSTMQSGSPSPSVAALFGGPYVAAQGATVSTTIPTGMSTPSTAHYGSIQNFLTRLEKYSISSTKSSLAYLYLINHLLPTVRRFATGAASGVPLCSYGLSDILASSPNLIQINSTQVTAYDNGVIVNIANNTDGDLMIKQCVNQSSDNQIGTLKSGSNNYFLNTASLMDGGDSTTNPGSVLPVIGNMIEFTKDEGVSIFVQVVTQAQLSSIQTNLATDFGTNTLVYNQSQATYQAPTATNTAYLLVTNFDVNAQALSSVTNCRMQAINLAEFQNQNSSLPYGPSYAMTLQINQEQIGYGLYQQYATINESVKNTAILYPSIVSVKTFSSWLNPFAQISKDNYFSAIPMLLIPKAIYDADNAGLKAYYGIWLMSYAAALTEFKFGCQFGNTMDCLQKTFKYFDVDEQQAPPARVIIDAQNVLLSGQTLSLQVPDKNGLQSKFSYLTLMGSDVWDFGNNLHQDIPILNLYDDVSNVPVANHAGSSYVNFGVTFEQVQQKELLNPKDPQSIETFGDLYGQPYANMMLFSLLKANMTGGVIGELSQPTAGNYQLMFKMNDNDLFNFVVNSSTQNAQNILTSISSTSTSATVLSVLDIQALFNSTPLTGSALTDVQAVLTANNSTLTPLQYQQAVNAINLTATTAQIQAVLTAIGSDSTVADVQAAFQAIPTTIEQALLQAKTLYGQFLKASGLSEKQGQEYGVLAFQKIYFNGNVDLSAITINFLNSADSNWNSSVSIPTSVTAVSVGQVKQFVLKYAVNSSRHELSIHQTVASAEKTKKISTDVAALIKDLNTYLHIFDRSSEFASIPSVQKMDQEAQALLMAINRDMHGEYTAADLKEWQLKFQALKPDLVTFASAMKLRASINNFMEQFSTMQLSQALTVKLENSIQALQNQINQGVRSGLTDTQLIQWKQQFDSLKKDATSDQVSVKKTVSAKKAGPSKKVKKSANKKKYTKNKVGKSDKKAKKSVKQKARKKTTGKSKKSKLSKKSKGSSIVVSSFEKSILQAKAKRLESKAKAFNKKHHSKKSKKLAHRAQKLVKKFQKASTNYTETESAIEPLVQKLDKLTDELNKDEESST